MLTSGQCFEAAQGLLILPDRNVGKTDQAVDQGDALLSLGGFRMRFQVASRSFTGALVIVQSLGEQRLAGRLQSWYIHLVSLSNLGDKAVKRRSRCLVQDLRTISLATSPDQAEGQHGQTPPAEWRPAQGL